MAAIPVGIGKPNRKTLNCLPTFNQKSGIQSLNLLMLEQIPFFTVFGHGEVDHPPALGEQRVEDFVAGAVNGLVLPFGGVVVFGGGAAGEEKAADGDEEQEGFFML